MAAQTRSEAPLGLRLSALAALFFLHFPIAIIILYAFTIEDSAFTFPPPGLTTQWFGELLGRRDFWNALGMSLGVAVASTLIALTLGTLTALAIYRAKFLGRDAI